MSGAMNTLYVSRGRCASRAAFIASVVAKMTQMAPTAPATPARLAKVRPDMSVVFIDNFENAEARLKQTQRLLRELVGVAEKKAA